MPILESHHGAFIVYGRGHGRRGTLVQTDWDYPTTAALFGWSLRRVQGNALTARMLQRAPNRGHGCDHRSTDGTVACPDCGVTASAFIHAAGTFLDGKVQS